MPIYRWGEQQDARREAISPKTLKQRREFFVSIGFTVVGAAVAFENVYIACLFWAVALFYSLQWVGHFDFLHRRRNLRRTINATVAIVAIAVSWKPVEVKRHEQLAGKTTGEIHATVRWERGEEPERVVYQIGMSQGCVRLMGTDSAQLQLFNYMADDGLLRVTKGRNGEFEIDAKVMDRRGNVIVSIDKNKWWVASQPVSQDHNYTDDSLEVKDSRGHVVFHVRLLPSMVEVEGEWHDMFGGGARLKDADDRKGAIYVFWRNEATEKQYYGETIQQMFVYPSKDHWGEIKYGY